MQPWLSVFFAACVPGIEPTRVDDPGNPPDTAIDGTVTIDDEDTFFMGGRYYTADPFLELHITFAGAATEAAVALNGASVNRDDFSNATELQIVLDESRQFQMVQVTFRDAAHHQGTTIRLDVELDQEPPEIQDAQILTDHRPYDNNDQVYAACDALPPTTSEPVVDVAIEATDTSSWWLTIDLRATTDTCDTVDFSTGSSAEVFTGIQRVLLGADQGTLTLCAQLTDAAGNQSTPEAVGVVLFDSSPPTSPRLVTDSTVVDGLVYELEFTQSTDSTGTFAGYEIFGGRGELGTQNGRYEFELCTTCSTPASQDDNIQVTFLLEQPQTRAENILRVRAMDCASNASDDDFRFVTTDLRKPIAPQNVQATEEDGAVVLEWSRGSDLDVDIVGYRVYYGTVSRNYSGTFATSGQSPVFVGDTDNFRLVGIPNGTTVYVAISALDDTEYIQKVGSTSECEQGGAPEQIGDFWYCREPHESNLSQEVAVLAGVVTPEPLGVGNLSNSWQKLSLDASKTRLFISSGSAVYPFRIDPSSPNIKLLANDGTAINQVYFAGNVGEPIASDGFTGDVAFSTLQPFAYVANGNAGVMVVANPPGDRVTLTTNMGNPANFSRHVVVFPDPNSQRELLAVGGDHGLQLFELGGQDAQNGTYVSPSFIKSVLSNKTVRALKWVTQDQQLYVSVYPDGLAILDADLEFAPLGTTPNPFCPAAFTYSGVPSCDIVDLERVDLAGFQDAGGTLFQSAVLIVGDRVGGVSSIDLTRTINTGGQAPPQQLGTCYPGGCLQFLQSGSISGIEVVPPYILVLGSHPAVLAPGASTVGKNVDDGFYAAGDVIEVIKAEATAIYNPGTLWEPESVADFATPGDGWQAFAAAADFKVVSDTVLVAQRNLGLKAYQFTSDLNSFSFSSSVDVSETGSGSTCIRPVHAIGHARKLALTGSRLIVADGASGAHILSLQNPELPQHELEMPIGPFCTVTPAQVGEAYDVAVTGPFAFVATARLGIRIFDMRKIVGSSVPITNVVLPSDIRDYADTITGDATAWDSVLHDQYFPAGDTVDPYPSDFVVRVATRRDRLWFVGFDTGSLNAAVGADNLSSVKLKLFAWDLTKLYDSSAPLAGAVKDEPLAWDATTDLEGTIALEDIGLPIAAAETGDRDLNRLLSNIEVNGDFLYLGIGQEEGGGVLRVFADPSTWDDGSGNFDPIRAQAEFFEYPSAWPRQIRVRGEFIYIADARRGLMILHESTGEVLASLKPQGQARSLAVEGNLVYLGTTDGMHIVSVETDTLGSVSLSTAGFFKTPAAIQDILLHSGLGYLATAEAGLRVVELADPTNPEPFPVAPFAKDDGSFVGEFSVSGAVAYLISQGLDFFSRLDNTLLMIDLRSPDKPISAINANETAPGATHVAVEGETLYVTALAPPTREDPYENISGPGNDMANQAAVIAPGRYEGAVMSGVSDVDWFVVPTNGWDLSGSVENLEIELSVQGDSGWIEGYLIAEPDCNAAQAESYFSGGDLDWENLPNTVRPFYSDEGPVSFYFTEDFLGSAGPLGDLCLFVRATTPFPQNVSYALTVIWDTVQACTLMANENTGDALDLMVDVACGAAAPRVAATNAEYQLCAASAEPGERDYFVIQAQADQMIRVFTASNTNPNLELYVYSDALCTALEDSSANADNFQFAMIDNTGNPPQDYYVSVQNNGGADYGPYTLIVQTGEEADAFGEDIVAKPIVSGLYESLFLPAGGQDVFSITPSYSNGDQYCVSIRGEGDLVQNSNIAVTDGASKNVSATVQLVDGASCFEMFGEPEAFNAVAVSTDCAASICEGTQTITIQNPHPFPLYYNLEVVVFGDEETDNAEPNNSISQVEGTQYARLVASDSWVGPLYVKDGDPDYFPITIPKGKRVTIAGEKNPSSMSEFNMWLVEMGNAEEEIRVFPYINTPFADTIDFVNGSDQDYAWYLKVENSGDQYSDGDYYGIDIRVTDGSEFKSRVEAFNAAPFGLIPASQGRSFAATADALAVWGPYAYHLLYNVGTDLLVTRFSEVDNTLRSPIDLPPASGNDEQEGWIRFPHHRPPLPPFTVVSEASRMFVVELKSSYTWFVDVGSVLDSSGGTATVLGPWPLFPEQASEVDGVLLHGYHLFVSSAARGHIFVFDVSNITNAASVWRQAPEGAAILNLANKPLVAMSVSTDVAGVLDLAGSRLISGLVGVTQQGPKSVGTAIFDASEVLALPPNASAQDGFEPAIFGPLGAATVGALDLNVVGPYLYVSNENGFQVLDVR